MEKDSEESIYPWLFITIYNYMDSGIMGILIFIFLLYLFPAFATMKL